MRWADCSWIKITFHIVKSKHLREISVDLPILVSYPIIKAARCDWQELDLLVHLWSSRSIRPKAG